ncbi:MAG: AMP-binding protein, partial [Kofleriaceae bacterium]
MRFDDLGDLLHADRTRSWCDGETQDALVAHAQGIAARLDCEGGRVVLSCRHARAYVPALLGAWLAGATVELLPNVQAGTLDRVDADPEVAYVLHDDAARQDRSAKAIYVPGVASAVASRPRAWPTLAVRMTTSGSTERPKYVTKSMAQLVGELDVLATIIPTAGAVLSTVPFSHLYGLLFGALLPLRSGARIVSHEALLPADLAAVIAREAVDLMISTPAHLRAMAAVTMPRDLRVISSGARMPAELHAGLASDHGWQVTDVLGSTETGGIATRTHPMRPWTALPGVTVTAPAGQLVVASPWCGGARVELDDRIEILPDGTFRYLGRTDELVKIAGKRAHAQAIEATVLAIPGVTDVALIVHDAAGREPRVAMAVVAEGVTREAIAAAIRAQFDAVFVPRIVKLVPRIPRTERGKRSIEALRALLGLSAAPTTNLVEVRRVAPGEYLAYIPRELVFFGGHFDELAI